MNSLILDSLEIRNFRAFRKLQIERLGRVNLIAGENNVGKTCLLEALWLYASRGEPTVMQQILADRHEFALIAENESQMSAIRYLFYGRQNIENIPSISFKIGESAHKNELEVCAYSLSAGIIEFIKKSFLVDREKGIKLISEISSNINHNDIERIFLGTDHPEPDQMDLYIQLWNNIKINELNREEILLKIIFQNTLNTISDSFNEINVTPPRAANPAVFIPYKGVDQKTVAQWWDKTYLTELEDDVIAALQIIEGKVRSVGLVDNRQQKEQRVPMVRLSDSKSPVLLSSLGQGMNHLFALALALVNAENGFLLIDEVENGIYHGTQPDLWRFILKMAQRLNVQVFATTHSRDSIEGFHQALQDDEQADGLLISLRHKQGKAGEVVGVLFERENLEIITTQQIEVR